MLTVDEEKEDGTLDVVVSVRDEAAKFDAQFRIVNVDFEQLSGDGRAVDRPNVVHLGRARRRLDVGITVALSLEGETNGCIVNSISTAHQRKPR